MIWFIKNMYRVYFVHVHEKVFDKFILNKYYIFTSGFWSWPSLPTISTLASSTFYRELLQYFQDYKNKTKLFSYGNFLIWNKKAVTIEKKMLFWKSRYLKRWWEFFNFWRIYFQLMAAIPSDLKKKAMSAEVPSHEQLLYSTKRYPYHLKMHP